MTTGRPEPLDEDEDRLRRLEAARDRMAGDAVVEGAAALGSDANVGVDSSPVRTVAEDGLAAAVSVVPRDSISDLVDDRPRLEELARAHDDVMVRLAASGTVVPFRLGTLCGTEDDVRALLRSGREPLRRALDHLRDRSEWGVKAFVEAPPAEDPSTLHGTEYLERKSERRRAR